MSKKYLLAFLIGIVAYFLFLGLWSVLAPYYSLILAKTCAWLISLASPELNISPIIKGERLDFAFKAFIIQMGNIVEFEAEYMIGISRFGFMFPITFALLIASLVFERNKALLKFLLCLFFLTLIVFFYVMSFFENLYLMHLAKLGVSFPHFWAYFWQFMWQFFDNFVIRFAPFLLVVSNYFAFSHRDKQYLAHRNQG